ncbi:MAG: hypothetical protein KAR38_13980 [Calditrichia bacterium]|nr:hypothetical protein [Calditrichia bacterium]
MKKGFNVLERFQKKYISINKFVDIWGKELYELTNLDYFIFQYINYLGNSLECRFWGKSDFHKNTKLSSNEISHLSYDLGQYLMNFLYKKCLNDNPTDNLNEFFEEDEINKIKEKLAGNPLMSKFFKMLISSNRKASKEEYFQVGLMNSVVMEVVFSFYDYDISKEIEEENLELVELSEFILEKSVEFINEHTSGLLKSPDEISASIFNKLLEGEAIENNPIDFTPWKSSKINDSNNKKIVNYNDYPKIKKIIKIFVDFISVKSKRKGNIIKKDLLPLENYLLNKAKLEKIENFDHIHLHEFMSYWLIQQLAFENEKKVIDIFNSTEEFIIWLQRNYKINLHSDYKTLYKKLKISSRRVIKALSVYYQNNDIIANLLFKNHNFANTIYGWFQIDKIERQITTTLNLQNIHTGERIIDIELLNQISIYLDKRDLLELTLYKKNENYQIIEIHNILPQLSKPFIL